MGFGQAAHYTLLSMAIPARNSGILKASTPLADKVRKHKLLIQAALLVYMSLNYT
jgi:hypothetical protein